MAEGANNLKPACTTPWFHLQLSLSASNELDALSWPSRVAPLESLMGVAILVCGCGLKVRAARATPAWGDAPSAAASCEFLKTHRKSSRSDQEPPIPLARNRAMVSNHQGKSPLAKKTGRAQPSDVTPPRTGYVERKTELPMAGGILPPLQKTEASWFASILYPLRSADSLAVIATLTAILWLFTILVPEYCLGLMGDADQMGTPTIGKLIALISILPVAFLLPFAVFYWIQYLGRVVVASAMGETIPPHARSELRRLR